MKSDYENAYLSLSDKEDDREAIRHLREAIADGKHWYIALMEAIGKWKSAEEIYQGQRYRYLIGGEAFDWLRLAERLCEEINGLIPEDERIALLFLAKPPVEVSMEEVKRFIGAAKYQAHLNYFYGVTLEEVLILKVEEEIQKERLALRCKDIDVTEEAFYRIYGVYQEALLQAFREEKALSDKSFLTLEEWEEFIYWLFKRRLRNCDGSRVASDTKKALEHLHHIRNTKFEEAK